MNALRQKGPRRRPADNVRQEETRIPLQAMHGVQDAPREEPGGLSMGKADITTVKATEMERGVHAATALLKALANPQRLRILCQLASGEKTVGALVEDIGMRQAAVSQQLQRLRAEHLVQARREGRHVYYSLSDPAAMEIIKTLYRLYCPH